MSNGEGGSYSAARMVLVIVVVLAVIGAVLWATGVFERMRPPPNTREVYTTDTKDLSGGKLIVTDESSPKVPVNLPTTKMTNVPPAKPASPSPPASPAGDSRKGAGG
jgi:hypothetical protein